MSELLQDLAAFASASRETWRKDVERTLKGRPFADALIRPTIEGLSLQPLYTRDDRPPLQGSDTPGSGTFVRGLPAPGDAGAPRRGWTRCIEIDHPDARRANGMMLADLQGGAERVIVRTVSARQAFATTPGLLEGLVASGRGGTWIDDIEDVQALVNDVMWPLAPVSLIAPPDPECARRLFDACAVLRSRHGEGLSTQIDLVTLAWHASDATGWLRDYETSVDAEMRRGMAGTSSPWDARPLGIATTDLRHAGADMGQEIAAAISAFVAVVRTLDARHLPAAAVLRATEFRMSVGADFFGEMAKLRAVRRCLALILDTLGIAGHAGDALITASTAEETLTRRDVHVNLLRTTAEATAAVLGGCDGLIIHPFDARLDGGGTLGRRLARNLHSLLAEESDAGTVVDPGGGSFYIEHRTEQLAEAAWQQFVEWERAGGYVRACRDGLVRSAIGQRWQTRAARLRTRRDALLGVSVFPNLDEKRPDGTPFDGAAFIQRWRARLGTAPPPRDTARLDTHYLDEEFETLRTTAERTASRTGSPPVVFGALLGPPATYTARLDWVRDLLATSGLRLDAQAVSDQDDALTTRLRASNATAAIVIAADALHGSAVPVIVTALRRAGMDHVTVAGRPGEHEAALRQAGASGFIFAGADVISFLTRLVAGAEAADVRS